MKKSFNQVIDALEYIYIEDTKSKTVSEVGDEIREFIRNSGWDCTDELEDMDDYIEDNDIDDSEFEDCAVCDVDFLCANEFNQEHDVDWHTFDIEFYGVWGKKGVFSVN